MPSSHSEDFSNDEPAFSMWILMSAVRTAGATKNALAAVMNASAVAVFVFSPDVNWLAAAVVAAGAIAGGYVGAWLLLRVNDRLLRGVVVLIGIALTVGLFVRASRVT